MTLKSDSIKQNRQKIIHKFNREIFFVSRQIKDV